MRFFHRTTEDSAGSILSEGFRDTTDAYMTRKFHTGVWLSNEPLDANEGATGETLLQVDLDLPEEALGDLEWVSEPATRYREWLIPAAIINAHGMVSLVNEEE